LPRIGKCTATVSSGLMGTGTAITAQTLKTFDAFQAIEG